MAFTAPSSQPSVPFLKPTGIESPLAISRWVWLSLVRAPIAAQEMQSARYCGVTGSSSSVAQGTPSPRIASRSSRARRIPSATWQLPSRCGSLRKPFQPTVVRGFSK